MIIRVEMLAFHEEPDTFRDVRVPNDTPAAELLDAAWIHGQNENQPVDDMCSVSVGDVIHLNGEKHLVAPIGFRRISEDQYLNYKATPRRNRWLFAYSWR